MEREGERESGERERGRGREREREWRERERGRERVRKYIASEENAVTVVVDTVTDICGKTVSMELPIFFYTHKILKTN